MIPNNILQLLKNFRVNTSNLQNIRTPDDMAQFLLNNGIVNQDQVNQAREMWNNPQIRQMINSQYK